MGKRKCICTHMSGRERVQKFTHTCHGRVCVLLYTPRVCWCTSAHGIINRLGKQTNRLAQSNASLVTLYAVTHPLNYSITQSLTHALTHTLSRKHSYTRTNIYTQHMHTHMYTHGYQLPHPFWGCGYLHRSHPSSDMKHWSSFVYQLQPAKVMHTANWNRNGKNGANQIFWPRSVFGDSVRTPRNPWKPDGLGPVSEFVGGCRHLSGPCPADKDWGAHGGRDTNKKEHICTLSACTKKERDTPLE